MTAVAFVLKGYPRLSETFIAQEIQALEARGLDIRIYSLRHPTDTSRHPVHGQIEAPVFYLPEYLYREPHRVWRAWRRIAGRPGYARARRQWLEDLRRDLTPNRIRRFGQALVLADELPGDVSRLHAHFLHTPASVTRYAAMILGLEWTCSAHAKDVWTIPDWEVAEKLADCKWLAACNRAASDRLAALAPAGNDGSKVALMYHGIDFARFDAPATPPSRRDGRLPGDPVRILSVGRAVAKKGYDDLFEALARLPRDLSWRLVHIGGGILADKLKAQARRRGVGDRIEWRGAQPQQAVLAAYRAADLFVLASRIAADGDRDGLPNVLMEAQSLGLACITTDVSAIPELISDGENGVLVPPQDPAALARAIEKLAHDPDLRRRLGDAGKRRVRRDFSHDFWADRLAKKFGLTPAPARDASAAG